MIMWILLSCYGLSAVLFGSAFAVWCKIWNENKSRLACSLAVNNGTLLFLSLYFGLGALDRLVLADDYWIGIFSASDYGRLLFWSVMLIVAVFNFGMSQGWFQESKH